MANVEERLSILEDVIRTMSAYERDGATYRCRCCHATHADPHETYCLWYIAPVGEESEAGKQPVRTNLPKSKYRRPVAGDKETAPEGPLKTIEV